MTYEQDRSSGAWSAREVSKSKDSLSENPETQAGSRAVNGQMDCPKCGAKGSMARHNADWDCHKCGYGFIDNEGYK